MYLGAHFSISGSYTRAIEEAVALECNTLQMFTKNQMQWKAKTISDEEAREFLSLRKARAIRFAFAHSSYLINLCSPNDALFKKSVASLTHEHERAEALGLDFLVIHPGSPGEAGERAGIDTMKRGLKETLAAGKRRCRLILETSAGQGNCVGWKFEHLAELLEASDRIGVCFDTCHVFAAGYDLSTEKGYASVMDEFDRTVGLKRLCAVHVNDSKSGLNSRVDRHENIGKGKIGKTAFRCLMTDERLAEIPKVLETPKEGNMDRVNLKLLRGLAEGAPCPK
jgi:deoxyribonuclease-4